MPSSPTVGPPRWPGRVIPYGEGALLLECADTAEVLGWVARLRANAPPGVGEVVPAARTVLLRLAPGADAAAIAAALGQGAEPAAASAAVGTRVVWIDVEYDGPDLAAAAAHCGMAEAALVAAHTAMTYTVAFIGFAPGFGYLTGLPDALYVPRLERPRTRVPAGSVGLAGEFTGVYPRESPGGWQLIGRTDVVLWDLDRDPPGLLGPGATVRFRAR